MKEKHEEEQVERGTMARANELCDVSVGDVEFHDIAAQPTTAGLKRVLSSGKVCLELVATRKPADWRAVEKHDTRFCQQTKQCGPLYQSNADARQSRRALGCDCQCIG